MSYFICDNCDKKHLIFGTQGIENLKSRFGVETLAQIPILPQLIQKIEKPIANEYIMGAVDKMIMALGKNSLLKKEIPEIKFDSENILLNFPDGKKIAISHRSLRSNCRCALCINEMTGEKMLKEKDIRADIAPKEIFPLGNYALGINWNDGHSSGIYSYEMIRELTNK